MSTPHVLGWCNDGFHEGRELSVATPCPGEAANGRECDCPCHEVAPEDPAVAAALNRWRESH